MGTILSGSHLTKLYTLNNKALLTINNVSVSFEENTFTAILGRSGSGKTTLLHLLSTLETPSSGEVYWYGKNISALSESEAAALRRKYMGFVFQNCTLLNEFTVYENITLPCIIDNRLIDDSYINELLHTLGLWEQRNYYPHQLSGGQIQRTSIARSLVTKPSIIFADEPTGQLDRKTAGEVLDLLLLSSRKFNMTIILVTHDLKLAQMADNILYLDDGQVKQSMEE